MPSTPEVAENTKVSINYRDNFAQFLTESERSAYTRGLSSNCTETDAKAVSFAGYGF
jgi:hypothetical protein